ncbi:hypothetical protein BC03BB108_B0014 (plasmid) [Bacillus cereus 03BB108]|nr:hypothetical protein BC03BB108_B0014 [Bacillus cereus 03BB108]
MYYVNRCFTSTPPQLSLEKQIPQNEKMYIFCFMSVKKS